MFTRIMLFLGTNFLVIATISLVMNILGIQPYLSAHGIDYKTLAIFCALWGTAGAFISLFMSKVIAKSSMGVVPIDPKHASREESYILDVVYGLAKRVGITTMPEVGIYDSPELNAFATGPSKNNALVAVSSGLLANMNREELEGVLGHEISHVANGDMVTMTFVQGIVNAFALFFSRILSYVLTLALGRADQEGNVSFVTYGLFTYVFDVLFTFLALILVAAYSRHREYRADLGGAKLAGRENMIDALKRLQKGVEIEDNRAPSLEVLKISHPPTWMDLFSTHPPLAKRIERLQNMKT